MVAAGGAEILAATKPSGYGGGGTAVKFWAGNSSCRGPVHESRDSLQLSSSKGLSAGAAAEHGGQPTAVGQRLVLSATSPQNVVVSRTPRFDLRRGVVEPVVLMISRREVEANDIDSVVQRLEEQFRLPAVMWRYRGQLQLAVDCARAPSRRTWPPPGASPFAEDEGPHGHQRGSDSRFQQWLAHQQEGLRRTDGWPAVGATADWLMANG